jgi:hypothetical protein
MNREAMPLYEFISIAVPEFRHFLADAPEWYRLEMNYPVAGRPLDFLQDLRKESNEDAIARLMERVEYGMLQPEHISSALCIDFIQPIADLPDNERAEFLSMLGPKSRECYDLQW